MSLKAPQTLPTSDRDFFRWLRFSHDENLLEGTGSPEGVVTSAPGRLYLNKSGGPGTTLYVKETGTGDTGWVAK
jgi:hypothetical protein